MKDVVKLTLILIPMNFIIWLLVADLNLMKKDYRKKIEILQLEQARMQVFEHMRSECQEFNKIITRGQKYLSVLFAAIKKNGTQIKNTVKYAVI